MGVRPPNPEALHKDQQFAFARLRDGKFPELNLAQPRERRSPRGVGKKGGGHKFIAKIRETNLLQKQVKPLMRNASLFTIS